MADSPPPPYSWSDPTQASTSSSYAGSIRRVLPVESQPSACSSADDYPHRHDVYITTAASQQEISGSESKDGLTDRGFARLHFWPPGSSSSIATPLSSSIPGEFKPEIFTAVQGFRDCGNFTLPRETGPDHLQQRVHDELSSRLREAIRTAVPGPENVDSVVSMNLNQEDTDSDNNDALTVHIYKIHVFTKNADALSGSEETPLLFKWAKPQSIYDRKSGFWEPGLLDVLDDGTFNAGKELKVLVRGVSVQQMETLRGRWREGVRVKEF